MIFLIVFAVSAAQSGDSDTACDLRCFYKLKDVSYQVDAINGENNCPLSYTRNDDILLKYTVQKNDSCVSVNGLISTTSINLSYFSNGIQITTAKKSITCQTPESFSIIKDVILANGSTTLSSVVNSDASIKFFSKANNTEMTSLVIGDEIRVVIDYGHAIDSNYQLSIKSCSLAASNQQLNLITGIIPNSDLKGLVKASNSTSNSQAEFEMHVFTIGDDSTATIQCDMFFEILSSTVTSSSTVAPLADTSITEAFTTPIEVLFEEYTTSPILQVSLDEDLSHVTQLNSTTGDSGESLPSSWTSSPNISCELQNASFTYEKIDSGDNGVININGTFVNGLSCFVPFAETCTNLIAVQITSLSIDPRDVGRAYGDNGSYNFTNENHPSDNNGILTYEEKCYDTIHFQYTRSNQTMFTIPQCGCLEHDQADCSQYYDEIKFGTPTTTRSHIFNGTDAKLIVNTDNVVPSEHLSFNWECKDNLNDFSHVTQLDSSAPISTFWTGSPNINCETQNASFTYEKNDNGNNGTVNINGTFFNEMSCLVTFAEICTDDITVEITSLSIETRDFIDVVSDDFDNNGLLTYEEKCYDTIHFQYTKNNQTTFTMPQCGCLDYDQEFNQAYSCSPTTIGTHILNGTDAKLIINTDESALSQQITFNWSCDSNDIP